MPQFKKDAVIINVNRDPFTQWLVLFVIIIYELQALINHSSGSTAFHLQVFPLFVNAQQGNNKQSLALTCIFFLPRAITILIYRCSL